MAEDIITSLHGREIGLGAPGKGRPGLAGNANARNLLIRGKPHSVTGTVATNGANATTIALQVVGHEDGAISDVFELTVWLSDAADGGGLTATTASGTVAAGSAGTDIGTLTSKKALRVLTDNTGKYVLGITDTAKTAFKVCVGLAGANGPRTIVAATLVTASYG